MDRAYLFTSDPVGFRQGTPEDSASFRQMDADPEMREFFPFVLTEKQSDELQYWCHKHIVDFGYGFFAVDQLSTGHFIGFTGCKNTNFDADFMPAVVIGWSLDNRFWDQGLASEGAESTLNYVFRDFPADNIVYFTACRNKRSERVTQKLDMHFQGDFEHPRVHESSGLRKHVLYSLNKYFTA